MVRKLLVLVALVASLLIVAPGSADAYWDCVGYDGWTECNWYPDEPVQYPDWWWCFGIGCTPCDPCTA